MAANPEPSFTPQRRWTIALNVSLLILLVASVLVMVNYLGRAPFAFNRMRSQFIVWKTLECIDDLVVAVFVLGDELLSFFSLH